MKFSCEMYRDGGCELMRTKETQFAEAQQLILDGGIRKRELKKQLAEAQKAQKVLDKLRVRAKKFCGVVSWKDIGKAIDDWMEDEKAVQT